MGLFSMALWKMNRGMAGLHLKQKMKEKQEPCLLLDTLFWWLKEGSVVRVSMTSVLFSHELKFLFCLEKYWSKNEAGQTHAFFLMFWRNAMFSREKTFIVVEITLFLLAWAWPLVSEKLQNASRPLNSDLFFSNSWARKTCLCPYVTESGIWLLTVLKPIMERQGWWKGKLALFWRSATRIGGWTAIQRPSPPDNQGQEFFKGNFRGV